MEEEGGKGLSLVLQTSKSPKVLSFFFFFFFLIFFFLFFFFFFFC